MATKRPITRAETATRTRADWLAIFGNKKQCDASKCSAEEAVARAILSRLSGYRKDTSEQRLVVDAASLAAALEAYTSLVQENGVDMTMNTANKENLSYEEWHKEILRRYGKPLEGSDNAMCGPQGYEEGLTIGAVLKALEGHINGSDPDLRT